MRLLVTGADGQVGREIVRRAGAAGQELLAMDRAALDIGNAAAVLRTVGSSRADVLINAAAYTAVDRAEQESDAAFAVNRDGPANLAAACARYAIPLLHISTDYVFDGSRSGPYREDDPVAPLGVYGRSKWEGEQAVRAMLSAHLILRVSWVFGVHGHNFVKTMLRLARERDTLRVVADQRGCPTYAGDLADTLLILAGRLTSDATAATGDRAAVWGTYHYCGTPATSWHGFASAIVDLAGAREPLRARTVVPIATADYPTLARRPANSVLECSRLRERLGIEPRPWRNGLEAMLKELGT